jgi:hypothetical protein
MEQMTALVSYRITCLSRYPGPERAAGIGEFYPLGSRGSWSGGFAKGPQNGPFGPAGGKNPFGSLPEAKTLPGKGICFGSLAAAIKKILP